MDETNWPEKLLEDMRSVGDPEADQAIEAVFAAGQVAAVNGLLQVLVRNEGVPVAGIPPVIADYLRRTGEVPALDVARLQEGESLFAAYGPEILMVLGLYAIPAAYAARRGVQVLHRTAYFEKRPMRRIWETTQFVVDVMGGGGLGPNGLGLRTAQKVRLMHAAIRHLLLADSARKWDAKDLGQPINQEDLAATLMEFSFVVIEGLRRLGIELSRREQESYLYVWLVVGRIMGVDARLLPANVEEAGRLTRAIADRQIEGSREGREMTAALIEGMRGTMPPFFGGFIASGMRFFLEDDSITRRNVADMLEIPPADWTETMVILAGRMADWAGLVARDVPPAAIILGHLKRDYIQRLLSAERGPGRPSFRIPSHLQEAWMRPD